MAGQTMIEKILARGAGLEQVNPGQLINVKVDLALGNDITAPVAIKEFLRLGLDRVFDPEKIVLVPDHFTPNRDIAAAEQARQLRSFAEKYGIVHYYEVGRMGVEHALLPEQGLVWPGAIIIGADSHTCTYGALGAFATGVGSTDLAAAMALGEAWFKVPSTIKFEYQGKLPPWVGGKDLILHTIGRIGVDGARYCAMEFGGEAIAQLSMDGRMTMTNMAIEAGGKCGYMEPDQKTLEYLKGRVKREFELYYSDEDARYEKIYRFEVSDLEPQVAFPPSPDNVHPVREAAGIQLDQVVIGSCTNGRLEDLQVAATLLKGRQVHPRVRLLVIPATQQIYREALKQGLLEIFVEAGAAVCTPTCGPCLGGHMGILARGEKALATTNRNFVGRMGHPESEVYLCGPAVAAASAVAGTIVDPREVLD
ncbi:MAG TPA: 3-isopropylmalate dehydratase large subunit [Bacillota bacterium]|nr:3-isopropylmalate dehydratase large subunit [Bacillota bacterium]HOB87752.1 3-isopropylmalate dehydratase large subunit [Bacillota bacterium]HOP68268.1 3-isopropylmalate dehydratase large subunit [Bacillota bacterium]HPT33138.1 3-isopropylmalate dehydratase large subunit [Bacillota bacterium]HQD05158.1 3-isopropylmalate dehydratase large subunit [Bacillota bacterium]